MAGLNISLNVDGNRELVNKLLKFGKSGNKILFRTLKRGAKDIHKRAFENLSGVRNPPGNFPVNVGVTGFLRRSEYLIFPGQSISSGGQTFKAGPLEALVGNSAIYASVVSSGIFTTKTGRKMPYSFGPRPFQEKAVDDFGAEKALLAILAEELVKEQKKRRLK